MKKTQEVATCEDCAHCTQRTAEGGWVTYWGCPVKNLMLCDEYQIEFPPACGEYTRREPMNAIAMAVMTAIARVREEMSLPWRLQRRDAREGDIYVAQYHCGPVVLAVGASYHGKDWWLLKVTVLSPQGDIILRLRDKALDALSLPRCCGSDL